MKLKRLGIIGTGSITQLLVESLAQHLPEPLQSVSFLCTERSEKLAHALYSKHQPHLANKITTHTNVNDFLAQSPQFVVECAGHGAVQAHAEDILNRGIELVIVSTGALADYALKVRLRDAAIRGETRLILSPGALGGVDVLSAAYLADIQHVEYVSRKPPMAWLGSKAEELVDLKNMTSETVFFDGTASKAATDYPKNANVAATIALAGLGFVRTGVKMIADPNANGNTHEIRFQSGCANVEIKITGVPHPENPKTSTTTAYALAREVLNRVIPIIV